MRSCPKMKAYIETLVDRFEFDWSFPNTLCLFLEGCDYLVVENMGEDQIRVANLLEFGPYWVADPMVVFYIAYGHRDQPVWIPIEVADMYAGWRMYAEPDLHGEHLILYDPAGQDRLAQVCEEVFVPNLIDFGWQRNGTKVSWPPEPRSHKHYLEEVLKRIDWSLVDEMEDDDGP